MSRVYWADHGRRIEAYDRPVSHEGAQLLAWAEHRPSMDSRKGMWHVSTSQPNCWPGPELTKKAAKASVTRFARWALARRRDGAA